MNALWFALSIFGGNALVCYFFLQGDYISAAVCFIISIVGSITFGADT